MSDTPRTPNGNQNDHDNIADFQREKERLKALEREKTKQQKRAKDPDHQPILNIPPVTKAICALLVIIHVALYFSDPATVYTILEALIFMPVHYTNITGHIPDAFYRPFTHMALHAGWFHIAINVGMLLAFGSAVEKFIGGRRLLVLLLLGGAAGAFTHTAFYWGSPIPLIGASGGISSLFGALIRALQDQGQMKPGLRGLLPITALWIGISVLFALFASPDGGSIAWAAHVGGFLAGLIFYGPVLRRVK